MHPGTVALVLVAAAAHAVWNTAAKGKRGDSVRFVWAYTTVSAVLCVVATGVWAVRHPVQIDVTLVVGAAVSGVLHVVYSLTLQTGYDRADLGVVYPVARGTGPVLTLAVAIAVLGERLSAPEVLGALAVIAGIVVVAGLPVRRAPGGPTGRPAAGVRWGVATGATIAAYTLWDDHAVTVLHLDPLSYFSGTLVVETLILSIRLSRPGGAFRTLVDDVRPDLLLIAVIAVLSPVAYVLVLIAMQRAPVGVVAALRESSIVLASFLAWWMFHEGRLPRRLVGAAVVLVGIVAISV